MFISTTPFSILTALLTLTALANVHYTGIIGETKEIKGYGLRGKKVLPNGHNSFELQLEKLSSTFNP